MWGAWIGMVCEVRGLFMCSVSVSGKPFHPVILF